MTVPVWIKGTLVSAVVFAAGLIAGIGYERGQSRSHHAVAADAHSIIPRLATELGLDSEQQQAIRQILARHQAEMDTAWHSMQPHVHATLDAALGEIEAVLRPDQAAKFRQLINAGHSGARH